MGEDKFYIVNEKSLPEIFKKVIEVKENIELGNAKDISEAIKLVGISRSTYYKYKDDVFPMGQDMQSKKVTLIVLMTHKSGTLSKVLDCIALTVAIIGAVNWGLIGFFDFNLVAAIFGSMSWISRIIYALVGICGLYLISFYLYCNDSTAEA